MKGTSKIEPDEVLTSLNPESVEDTGALTLHAPPQHALIYRIHHRRIGDDAEEMRREATVEGARAFFCEDEFEGLEEACVFREACVRVYWLAEASADYLREGRVG